MKITDFIPILEKCAGIFAEQQKHLSLGAAAARLDCSPKYLREHLSDFPNAWRLPGGEIRIPVKDIESLARARRFLRAA
jgi:hypothetical protein